MSLQAALIRDKQAELGADVIQRYRVDNGFMSKPILVGMPP